MAILSLSVKYRPLEKRLALLLRRALIYLRKTNRVIDVYLVPNREMKKINRRFRGKDKVTTVLSFLFDAALPYPRILKRPLGEIYLAPDYVKKIGGSPETLLIHGLVHLLGYTHDKNRDKIIMEKLEARLLKRVTGNQISK